MRRTSFRLALVSCGLAAVGLALPAHAGTAPLTATFADASGDVLAPGLKGDITKLTYTTQGTTVSRKVGTRVTKIYTPNVLVITLETADAIDTSGTTTYEIDSDVAGCDNGLDVYFTPGVDGSEGGGCSNGDIGSSTSEGLDGAPTVAGNKITFTLHFKGFSGKQVKVGTAISGIHAYTALVEPVFGLTGPYLIDTALANDNLTTDATYKVG